MPPNQHVLAFRTLMRTIVVPPVAGMTEWLNAVLVILGTAGARVAD
jgi:hypothetical protein